MSTLRDIKHKIGSVQSTQQITKAMNMMASVKLRRAMERLQAAHFYLAKLEQIVADLFDECPLELDPTFSLPRSEVRSIGIVVIAGERGLCGSFNHDLFKFTERLIAAHPAAEARLILIGKKACEFYRRSKIPILGQHKDISGEFLTEEINRITRNTIGFYRNELIDELHIVYTTFFSPLERFVVSKQLLPLISFNRTQKTRQSASYDIEFQPDPQTVFQELIPRYVQGLFQKALFESSASEESARMMAMGAATDKAQEMLDEMRLLYNRTRQAVITKELAEVTAGAEALQA